MRSTPKSFSHARIHISPSPTANDKDSIAEIERREYFACPLTDGRRECTLFFAVSCRCRVVPYNLNRPLTVTLYSSIITTHVYNDTKCSVSVITL
jgi:hypothetical protein